MVLVYIMAKEPLALRALSQHPFRTAPANYFELVYTRYGIRLAPVKGSSRVINIE